MTVRRHVPWPHRAAMALAVAALASGLGLWLYMEGRSFAGFGMDVRGELNTLRDQVAALTSERDRLSQEAQLAQSRLAIEQAAQGQLGIRIKSLEMENAKLKDDLAFYENLSANGPVTGFSIKRFEVRPDTVPQQMRYRLLLTQGGRYDHDFSGDLQLIVTLQQGGKAVIMNLPGNVPGLDPRAFAVTFRFFKRLEGTFAVPEGATVTRVEARLIEKGTVRAQETVMVSPT